jgi:hypothetical protein
VDVGNDPALQLTRAGTISLWLKYSPNGSYQCVLGNMDFSNDLNGYAIGITPAGLLYAEIADSSSYGYQSMESS